MKVSRIPEALAAGMDGDVSEWEECQGRAPDHPVRRMDLGSGFRVGRLADGRTILYLDDGFSLTAEVTSLDDGTLSGPSAEAVFGAFGGRRTHALFDPAEYGRFAALTFYRDASVTEDGVSFVITDELEIDLGEPTEGAMPRFPCTVTYVTRDGKVSLEASGEAVHLPNGPAVVGDGFTLLFPTDLLALRRFREGNMRRTLDTAGWLSSSRRFAGRPEAAAGRRGELASALSRLRPGSRTVRVPRDSDGGEDPWNEPR